MSVSGTTQGVRPGVCLSTTKPASPFTGQIIYMSDTDETAVWDGSYWEGLDRSRDRNLVINGAMQIHQRGTTGNGSGYQTVDRFDSFFGYGSWTPSVQNDAPSGSGFRKSYRALVATAATPSGLDQAFFRQRFEGQNLQAIRKGTPSAKPITISFWTKSNITGTYIVNLLAETSPVRQCSGSYVISASDTWQRKIITFPADTTGEFVNDNLLAMSVRFFFGAGSSLTSSPLATSWAALANDATATGQVNVASAINNYWQITGVQLEVGSVATPFEFEDYGTTLLKCQRYYWRGGNGSPGIFNGASTARYSVVLPTEMRTNPVVSAIAAPIVINPGVAEQQTGSQTTNFSVTGYGANVNYSVAQIQFGGFSSGADGRPTVLLNTALQFNAEL